jgi:hypothetical protein
MFTHERCFLSKVWSVAGNYKLAGDATFSLFTSQAVNPTAARAKTALLQD